MKDLVNKIEKLGFSTYEAKVFLVLYQGYSMPAADVAKEARIPRTSAYEILRSFAQKGICNEIKTPTKLLYEIIDTNIIQDKIQIDIEKDYKNKLADLTECFRNIKPLFKSKTPQEYRADVELIKGYNRQREQKFLELVKSSSTAILVMNKLRGNISVDLDDESLKFKKRGGLIKTIYETSTNFRMKINNKWQNVTHEGLIKLCESFTNQGEQVKLIDNVPQIMAVFDEKIVYFSLFDEGIPYQEQSDVIIKNKNFATFIIGLFNLYWDKADTIEELKKHLNKQ